MSKWSISATYPPLRGPERNSLRATCWGQWGTVLALRADKADTKNTARPKRIGNLKMLSFAQIDAALERIGATTGAAESHGVLCGLLCTPSGVDETRWLKEILGGAEVDDAFREEYHAVLLSTYAETVRQWDAEDCVFSPLLPEDSEPLARRTRALGAWCQGFLFGLGVGRITELTRLPADCREIIMDLVAIARVSVEMEASEATEAAYAELVEYLRVGVMLMNEELNTGITSIDATAKGV